MAIEELLLDEALEALIGLAATREPSASELARSARSFLGATRADDDQRAAAARRHAEWFLLERPCDATGGSQLEELRDELLEDRPELSEAVDALRASFAGVFRTTSVQPGEGVWLRDLAGLGEYALHEVEGSTALAVGDLLVGRLFPIGDGLHRVSRAAGCFRNPELAAAIERDLERARAGRRGVLRLAQSELETMFFGAELRRGEDATRRACEVLASGGLPAERAEALVAGLLAEPFDPSHRLPGTNDALGDLLNKLAFETEIDLGEARAALIEAWAHGASALQGERATPKQATADALEAFDRGRAEGRDLEELFAELERDLGLDPDDAEDLAPAPDFPGVVGAMVVEFLWETDREHGQELALRYRALESFARFGAEYGVFENLGRRELLTYCTLWLPEQGGLTDASQARDVLAALRAFCAWASAEQQVELEAAFESFREDVERSLPRVVEINRLREAPGAESGEGRARVLAYESEGRARDAEGDSVELRLPEGMDALLEPGDLVRVGRDEDGTWRVRCVYPPEGALLAEAK